MSIPDPHLPAPMSEADAIALLAIGGVECIKPAMEWLEANRPDISRTLKIVHRELTRAGYLLEEALRVPDGTFGAGGGGPKPW